MAELVLAGAGPARDELLRNGEKRLCERGIALPGFVSGRQKARLLLDATMFVLPSRHAEGCPVTVLEIMAAGLPVATTRVGAVLAQIRLLADADLKCRMAERNRAKAGVGKGGHRPRTWRWSRA